MLIYVVYHWYTMRIPSNNHENDNVKSATEICSACEECRWLGGNDYCVKHMAEIDRLYAEFAKLGGNVETLKAQNLDYAILADFVARLKMLVAQYNEARRA